MKLIKTIFSEKAIKDGNAMLGFEIGLFYYGSKAKQSKKMVIVGTE